MEETIRRTSQRRNTVNHHRKTRPVYNYKLLRRIITQLIICIGLILAILVIKNLNTPLSRQVDQDMSNYLKNSTDYSGVYKYIVKTVSGLISNLQNVISQPNKEKNQTNLNKDNSLKKQQSTNPNPNTANTPNQKSADQANTASSQEGSKSSSIETDQDYEKNTEEEAYTSQGIKIHALSPASSSISSVDVDAKNIKANISLSAPVKGSVSSGFGIRINPITNKQEFHPGLDIKAVQGTAIRAAMSGIVLEARKSNTFGNFIRIKSGRDVISVYAHCSKLLVKAGQKVKRGQKIGEVGNTGMSSGAHLHFETTKGGRYVDPTYLFSQYK